MSYIFREALIAWGAFSFFCILLYLLNQITERVLEIKRKIDLVDDLIVRLNMLEGYVDRDHMRLIHHIIKDEKDVFAAYADGEPMDIFESDEQR